MKNRLKITGIDRITFAERVASGYFRSEYGRMICFNKVTGEE